MDIYIKWCQQLQSRCHTFPVDPLHPLQMWIIMFNLRKILWLVVEVAERDLHVAELILKGGRTSSVGAGVVLARGPSLLHAGWVMQGLRFIVSISGSLSWIHAMLPTTLDSVAPGARVRHLIHVRYTVVHHEEPKQKKHPPPATNLLKSYKKKKNLSRNNQSG